MKEAKLLLFSACLWFAGVTPNLQAAIFTANFDDGQAPPNTAVFGNAVVERTGGAGGTGALKLTKAVNSQQGSFIIEDFDSGATVYGINVSMLVRVGGGSSTPADGFSFNFGPDLPDASISEEGAGMGLIVAFDTYDNGGGEAPAIDIKVGGLVLASTKLAITNLLTGNNFVPVNIRVDPDGSLDLDYNGKVIYTNFFIPFATGLAGGRFGFGARTGGLNANQFIDNLRIETILEPAPGIWRQPASQAVLDGQRVTFFVGVNNIALSSIQWLRNGQPIAGATTENYITDPVSMADEGTKYSVRVAIDQHAITSDEAIVHVVRLDLPLTPALSYDFNDGVVPLGTTAFGNAYVEGTGGVNDSGVLKLTIAENSQAGAFLVEDPHNNAPVYGFAARFQMRVGGGTTPPADGFSFNFAPDLPDDAAGMVEEGLGSGVSVTFDTYDNGGGEAPGIEFRINRVVLASRKVPIEFLSTGDGFAEVIMRLAPDGLFYLAWNGVVVFEGVPAEGFSSFTGGRYGIYARTGGLNDNHWVDDIRLFTYLESGIMRISKQPKPLTVLIGKSATFTVEVNEPAKATYQWFRNGQVVAGATQSSLTIASVTANDDQAKFKVEVTGPNNKVTSDEVILSVLNLAPPINPQVNFDFNNGLLPPNTRVFGSALVEAFGGVNDSGVLQLTPAQNSLSGIFLIDPIEGGAELNGFTAALAVRVGGGTTPPADGFSFNFANNIPDTTIGEAENGAGTGITVAFDNYDNGGGEAPAIDLKYRGQFFASTKVPLNLLETGDAFVEVLIRVRPTGLLDLAFGDQVIYSGMPIPGFQPIAGGRFVLAARTGGLNANHWIDNLRIGVTKPAGPTRITRDPANALVLEGQTATFTVLVNDPQGVAYQWFRNGTTILSATQSSYTVGPLTTADSGSLFTVTATGPGGAATSNPAKLTVMQRFAISGTPAIAFDFNDGAVPPGSVVVGSAAVDYSGGINDSGVLKLTVAENSLMGAFLFDTPAGVSAIQDLIVTWKMRVGGGTEPPADGFSFVLGSDIQESAFGEEGAGSGLVVSFDTYDNGGGEAPAIDVRYGGTEAASRKLPISVIRTGDQFVDVSLRIKRDGTLDLIYGDNAIYANLPLPDFKPFEPGRFAFGGRTGGLNDNHWVDDLRIAVNTLPVVGPPKLTIIRKADGKVQISWDGPGILQSATTLPGAWTDIPAATSPYELAPTKAVQFYRVKR